MLFQKLFKNCSLNYHDFSETILLLLPSAGNHSILEGCEDIVLIGTEMKLVISHSNCQSKLVDLKY